VRKKPTLAACRGFITGKYHRYIETIPRRGYRFVAPVRKIPVRGSDLVVEKHSFARVVTEEEEELRIFGKAGSALSAFQPKALLAAMKWALSKRRALYLTILLLFMAVGLALVRFRAGERPSAAPITYPLRLTNNPASDTFVAWSPDGSKIAFTSNRDGKPKIYVIDVDGGNVRRLTNTGATTRRRGRPTARSSHSRLIAMAMMRFTW